MMSVAIAFRQKRTGSEGTFNPLGRVYWVRRNDRRMSENVRQLLERVSGEIEGMTFEAGFSQEWDLMLGADAFTGLWFNWIGTVYLDGEPVNGEEQFDAQYVTVKECTLAGEEDSALAAEIYLESTEG